MRLMTKEWSRFGVVVAVLTLALSCGRTATSQESETGTTPAAVANDAVPGKLPMGEPARLSTTIPDPPTLAPRRNPTLGESSLQTDSAATPPAANPLEVRVRTDAAAAPPAPPAAEVAKQPEQESLKPIPDSQASSSLVEVGTASFNGIVPGSTTLDELQKAWGIASKIAKRADALVYLYSVDPFDNVEVSVVDDKVTSIVIRLDRTFPASTVAEQLELASIRPVLVSNPLGEILGQAFPERGVMLAFTPAEKPTSASMEVSQIILEPVTAEPFVLRAETFFDRQLELTVADLEQAIKLNPKDARAQWLLARALSAVGELASAVEASAKAVQLAPADAQYRTTYAQVLGQAERFDEAIAQAQKAAADAEQRPHILARTWCLLGDLYGSGPDPDYRQAIEHHMKAIKTAEPLTDDPHPAIRQTASEVLLDAHLGAAHDVAWGKWNQKEVAVPRWLRRASEIAEELSANDTMAAEYRFRVAQRALAVHVALDGKLDPTPWTEQTLKDAEAAITAAHDSLKKQKLLLDLGTALYDAVQVYQVRGEYDVAMKCGEQAVQCFEQVAKGKKDATADNLLLGRLYFRLGAILAIGKQDHPKAVAWFDKSLAAFDKAAPEPGTKESGSLGESLVSMGVSFWETDQHEKASRVTERGVKLIEKAVDAGALDRSALEIPYGNLAAMQRTRETADESKPVVENAQRDGDSSLK